MVPTDYAPTSPSVVTDFDGQSTAYATSAGSPSVGSPTWSSGFKGTTVTSVTHAVASSSPAQPPHDGAGNKLDVGWPKVAQKLAKVPCRESYPRFRELNVKNLLYYQVELAALESRLHTIEQADYKLRREPREVYYRNAEKMLFPARPVADPDDAEQRQIIRDIRILLREYNDALIQHAQITAMPQPDYLNIEALRVELGGEEDVIAGAGSTAWGDPTKPQDRLPPMRTAILSLLSSFFWKKEDRSDERDLVTVHQPKKLDGLTRWIRQDWTPFYHNYLRKHLRRNVEAVSYRESMMLKFTSSVTMVIACVLPTVAIGVLTTAKTTMQKLLYIGGFTALFAIGVMWLTDAGTSQLSVFTATAAFSAVLVVFVQNQ